MTAGACIRTHVHEDVQVDNVVNEERQLNDGRGWMISDQG